MELYNDKIYKTNHKIYQKGDARFKKNHIND